MSQIVAVMLYHIDDTLLMCYACGGNGVVALRQSLRGQRAYAL